MRPFYPPVSRPMPASLASRLVCRWELHAPCDFLLPILPDGCMDWVFFWPAGEPPRAILAGMDLQARGIPIRQGDRFLGLRVPVFARGMGVGPQVSEVLSLDPASSWVAEVLRCGEDEAALDWLDRHLEPPGEGTCDLMMSVALGRWQASRTLHRHMTRLTGVSPNRWHMLARARRAAAAVMDGAEGLAELALDCGYADQAHLTRELRAYLGVTPAALRRQKHWRSLVTAPSAFPSAVGQTSIGPD